MTRYITLFSIILTCMWTSASDVIISQYIETDSGTTPKGIEIWNVSGSNIDFSSRNLVVELGRNGATPSTYVTVDSGTLFAGDVWVIGTSDMSADTVYGCDFNGDDSLVIKLGSVPQDVFGDPGSDPGSDWSGNGVSTANQNIQIKAGITDGDVDGWTDPSERFETVSTTPSGAGGQEGFGIAPEGGSGGGGPEITAVSHIPTTPVSTESTLVTMSVYPTATVTGAELVYTVNSGSDIPLSMNTSGASTYTSSIPAQIVGALVDYTVYAWNNDGTNSSGPYSFTVKSGTLPYIERTELSVTPEDDKSVTVYIAAVSRTADVDTVELTYTTDGWGNSTTLTATRRAGKVYFTNIPGQNGNIEVEYFASVRDTIAQWGYGPTNSYTVRLVGSGSNVTCRIMAANTTSGNYQAYESPGIRIFQGLKPDVVGIQEFNYESGTLRDLVDTAFGTEYYYHCESGSEQIPNGIISRWPIIAAGEWEDTEVSNRDFAWATIDIPGSRNLHVVSVHLLTSGSTVRNAEAQEIVTRINASFSQTDYIVVCGDMNTGSRTESAITTLKTVVSDSKVPVDQNGNDDTNANRNSPYDYVMPNATLESVQIPSEVEGHSFNNGLVYDSRVTSPYQMLPSPIQSGDSGAANMQHMAVIKDFQLDGGGTPDVAPTLASLSDVTAIDGQTIQFDVPASDADGQMVTVTCSQASLCPTVIGTGAATGAFFWTVGLSDMGDHAIVFTAESGGLYAQKMINITVIPEPAGIIFVIGIISYVLCRRGRLCSARVMYP